ncbi:MAG: hypothetical protein HY657_10930 [Acidobacteria bacterium]|nr:hypothetical protein [Acidobacteriota bacterium]
MNFARIAAAAVVAWIASIAVGFFVNTVLLADLALANTPPMRQEAELMGLLPVGFVFLLVGFFAFAYAYAKGYEGGSGVMEGVRFGVLVSLIVIGFGLIWQYVAFPISGTMAAAIIVDAVVEFSIYGAIVGAIYRPVGVPARRAVGA